MMIDSKMTSKDKFLKDALTSWSPLKTEYEHLLGEISSAHLSDIVSTNYSPFQGPRSNSEIGGGRGAPFVTQYWGGGGGRHKTLFLLILYNF